MPLFRFEALSEDGKKIQGSIDAEGLQEAKLKLLRRNSAVIRVVPFAEKEKRVLLRKRDLLLFTRELSRLLHAGFPLLQALLALEEKYRRETAHPLFLDLADQIRSGQSFSKALERHSRSFDLFYRAMIATAEKTAQLNEALENLAELLSRQLKLRKQILSALIYPAILFLFCGVVLSSLLFFVIPSLKELFEARELHPFTKMVFWASHFACRAKGILVVGVLSFFVFLGCSLFLPSWKERFLSVFMRVPFLRPLFAKVALIRFSRAVATLLDGGLSLLPSFSQARHVMRHKELEGWIAKAEERISQGEPLSQPFQGHPLIPPLVPRMLAIAEQSGRLSSAMQQIAEIYEEEVENTLSHFATVAQPILLLVLGAIVAFVLLSVLLPLTDVSSFIN